MAYVAVSRQGTELIYSLEPSFRGKDYWYCHHFKTEYIKLPKGSIRKLIGRDLTWEDKPVELKNEMI